MPDLARNRKTGLVVDARELYLTGEGLDDGWECPCKDCKVEMVPVACGEGKHKVSPHFRAGTKKSDGAKTGKKAKHTLNCKCDGLRKVVVKGKVKEIMETMGVPEAVPSVLRLANIRPQLPASEEQEGLTEGEKDTYRGKGEGDPRKGTHESSASTIRRIAEAFAIYPRRRMSPLKIPNCCEGTYLSCVKKLENTNGEKKFDCCILYAPISFTALKNMKGAMTLTLEPGIWPVDSKRDDHAPPTSHYQLTVHTQDWGERVKKMFEKDSVDLIKEQMKRAERKSRYRVYAFFMGRQNEGDLKTFHINDHRLICFLTLNKNELAV